MFDVWVMLIFGVIGFALERARYPLGPFVIGFVLAPLMEAKLRTGLMMTGGSIEPMFTRPLSLIFLLIAVVLLAMDWRLALLSFLVLPLVAVAAFGFSKKVRDVFRELRVKVAEINTRFSETISGIKVIQSFGHEDENFSSFARLNHSNYLAGMRQINIFAVFMPIIEMLGITAIAIVIFVGGGHVLQETISIGVLAAFLSYMKMFFRPIRDLAEKYNILQNALEEEKGEKCGTGKYRGRNPLTVQGRPAI